MSAVQLALAAFVIWLAYLLGRSGLFAFGVVRTVRQLRKKERLDL